MRTLEDILSSLTEARRERVEAIYARHRNAYLELKRIPQRRFEPTRKRPGDLILTSKGLVKVPDAA